MARVSRLAEKPVLVGGGPPLNFEVVALDRTHKFLKRVVVTGAGVGV